MPRSRCVIRALIFPVSVFLTSLPAFAQLVQIGPNDPSYCVKVEQIKPNLQVAISGEVKGQLRDQSGQVFKTSRVELRDFVSPEKQNMIATTTTDSEGLFEFRYVAKGEYRLLASPSRAFRQPEGLRCSAVAPCVLDIVLEVNPTDLLASECPIR
jgi:hypothetical protein